MRLLCALAAGLLFGGGLLLSGMTNPANIIAFLDVTGHWQPALLFTLAGAVAVAFPAYWVARRQSRSLLGELIVWPDRFGITRRLVVGSAIFGAGWGLCGVCPGPALVLLTRPRLQAVVFCAGMAAGLLALRPGRGRGVVAGTAMGADQAGVVSTASADGNPAGRRGAPA
jgi:uncharacterized membrane protein YedE/YeeE